MPPPMPSSTPKTSSHSQPSRIATPKMNGVIAPTDATLRSEPIPADTEFSASVTVAHRRAFGGRDVDFGPSRCEIPCCYDSTLAVHQNPQPSAGDPGAGRGGSGTARLRPVLHRPHGDSALEQGPGLARPVGRALP